MHKQLKSYTKSDDDLLLKLDKIKDTEEKVEFVSNEL